MKYKENDYVRTKDGIIDKVIIDYNGHCADPKCNCKHVSCVYNYYDEDTIVKSSPSIIDLIEVGDYVNGEKVFYLKGDIEKSEVANEEDVLYTKYNDEYGEWYGFAEDEIESIVTHEQFESMEYKL